MKHPSRAACLLFFLGGIAALTALGEDDTPFTRLFDSGAAPTQPLAPESIARRTGWKTIPEDKIDYQFSGDAVMLNDKLAVVLRTSGSGAEVYSKTTNGLKLRATLGFGSTRSSGLASAQALKIIENTSGGIMLETIFRNPSPAALRFRLTTGEALLEIRAPQPGFLDVETRTRYVVVPDYFGDDMVYGPEAFSGLWLPAENFCLNLLESGEAILMSVWESSEQGAWLAKAAGKDGPGCSHRIQCLKDKRIWLAFLENPGLWHSVPSLPKDNRNAPFPAKWRASFVRENSVADSWDLERGPRPEQTSGRHIGPLVSYPLDRTIATPLTATCPTDVMRNTLGVGPCQYILACEGMGAQGDPTPNSVMGWVEKQFEQKKEKKAAEEIKERLELMAKHIGEAEAKIGAYAKFAVQVRKTTSGQNGADLFRAILDDFERSTRAASPAPSGERARQLTEEVIGLIGKDSSLPQCRRIGEELRAIGAVQDSALARCRMATRRLRQLARTVAENQPANAGLARDIQRQAEDMLKSSGK